MFNKLHVLITYVLNKAYYVEKIKASPDFHFILKKAELKPWQEEEYKKISAYTMKKKLGLPVIMTIAKLEWLKRTTIIIIHSK